MCARVHPCVRVHPVYVMCVSCVCVHVRVSVCIPRSTRRTLDEGRDCDDPRLSFQALNFDCVRCGLEVRSRTFRLALRLLAVATARSGCWLRSASNRVPAIHSCCIHFAPCRHNIGGTKASQLPSGLLDELFGTELNSLHPYGIDPVFLSRSSLYQADLADNVDLYYNTSAGSVEVSATGAPHAFYARQLPGYPDGFPVMLPNLLSEGRLNQTLTILKVQYCMYVYPKRKKV
jgi:hypothetical protein